MSKNSFTYPDVLRRFRQRSNHGEVLGEVENQLSNEIKSLHLVKTCLSIGTGYGGTEIEFIKTCLPNIKKLIVVEKDPNCLMELRVNLRNAFGDKLEIEIHEATIEDFMNENRNCSSKIDLILALYVLYFLTPEIRKDLFNLCFGQWLEPQKGMLVFANPSKENDFVSVYNKITKKTEQFQDMEMMKKEIRLLDLNIIADIKYTVTFTFEGLDLDLFGMLKAINQSVTEEMIKDILGEVCPGGIANDVCELCLVQNSSKLIKSKNVRHEEGKNI